MRFFVTIAIFFCLMQSACFANDLYEVRNMSVSSNLQDTSKAREQALDEAQIKAFQFFLDKLDIKINFKHDDIKFLVRDYEIENEKMTLGKYSASVNVSFSRSHLESFLLKQGFKAEKLKELGEYIKSSQIKKDEIYKERKILVFPLMRKNGELVIWDEDNKWFEAWKEMVPKLSAVEYVVPVGDLDDIRLTSNINIASAPIDSFENITKKYKANEVLIAIADVILDEEVDIYKLNIMVKQQNQLARNNVLENFANIKGDDLKSLFVQAVENVLSGESNIEKYINMRAYGSDETKLTVIANINSPKDWGKVQNILNKSKIVTKFALKNITFRNFYIELDYLHTPTDLITELMYLGLDVKLEKGYLTIRI